MQQYIIINAPEKSALFIEMMDQTSKAVDHKNQGTGMILCSSSINRLRTNENIVHIPDLDILLDPTIFGVTVSESVPVCLESHIEVVMANNIVPVLITDIKDPCLFMSQDSHTLQEDLMFLWGQENLGIVPNEMHDDDRTALDMFLDSVQRDPVTGKFTVRLPWNNKKYMLSDNIYVAAARTKRQLQIMIDDRTYGEAMCSAKQELEAGDYRIGRYQNPQRQHQILFAL